MGSFWSVMWVYPKIVVPQNGWFIMENPIKMDDLGVPPFKETSMWRKTYSSLLSFRPTFIDYVLMVLWLSGGTFRYGGSSKICGEGPHSK